VTGSAVAVALAAAAFYALAATMQHRAAQHEKRYATLDPRLLLTLIRSPLWMVGILADLIGVALHAFALGFAPLSLVQPLLISGLVLAVPLDAIWDRHRPRNRDLVGVMLSAIGLGVFVATIDPQPGVPVPDTRILFAADLIVAAFVAACIFWASRSPPGRRGTLLGIATGGLYAVAAALAKVCVVRFETDRAGILADGHLYALALVGIAAVVLNQNAFQAGSLAGPLTGITLTDPLASLLIATLAFGEQVDFDGWSAPLAIAAALVMTRGVWLVSKTWANRPPR
jgi:drug/metabolite transporter (DMT)-like permease